MKNKKRIISITVVVIALIVCISALTLALWTKSFEQTGTSSNQYGCFTITYSDKVEEFHKLMVKEYKTIHILLL